MKGTCGLSAADSSTRHASTRISRVRIVPLLMDDQYAVIGLKICLILVLSVSRFALTSLCECIFSEDGYSVAQFCRDGRRKTMLHRREPLQLGLGLDFPYDPVWLSITPIGTVTACPVHEVARGIRLVHRGNSL